MIQKVKGIVLHHLKYGDTSIIVHLYTNLLGRQTIIVKGARGARKNRKISLYHPLALLEMELYYKENRDIHPIKEAHPILPLQGLMADPVKHTVAIFLAEVIYRTIREKEANAELFQFLSSSIQYYDLMESGTMLFHLHLLIHLTRFLGFKPETERSGNTDWFDLNDGRFTLIQPIHGYRLNPDLAGYFYHLLHTGLDQLHTLTIPRTDRNLLLQHLINYYQIHLDGLGEIKSFSVLKAVFE